MLGWQQRSDVYREMPVTIRRHVLGHLIQSKSNTAKVTMGTLEMHVRMKHLSN